MSNAPSSNNSSEAVDPSTPTRSEIESALSGRTKTSPKKARPNADAEFDLSIPPRRQQVIGGNLSGISNQPKLGIFSRYSNMSISNWVATAIVVLIMLAFFWPSSKNSTLETTAPETSLGAQLGETDLSIDEQNELLESETKDSDLSFSRDSDLDRAGQYRTKDAQDLQIRSLLDQAKLHISDGRLLEPSDNSALNSYQAVLKIDSRNLAAREGIDLLKARFLKLGISALNNDKVTVSRSALASLKKIDADADEAENLKTAIGNWKTAQTVTEFLSKAESARRQNALILPARRNALYFYQQALKADPKNDDALKGIKNIADNYIDSAKKAVVEGDFRAASAHLATVSVIDSTHESIPLLEALIIRTKSIADSAKQAQNNKDEDDLVVSDNTSSRKASDSQSNDTEADDSDASDIADSKNSAGTPITKETSERPPVSLQTSEQQTFDRQYLKRGLEAYYQGEYGVAAALLQPLADKGIARAQLRLAYMYFLGRGFEKNRTTADSMIRAALPAVQKFADDGRAWAQSDLGSLYEDGLVLPRDYSDAFKWYERAANQGYPGAQTNLGMMYARGRGIDASRKTAIEWFQKAARQGDSVAKRNLEALGVE